MCCCWLRLDFDLCCLTSYKSPLLLAKISRKSSFLLTKIEESPQFPEKILNHWSSYFLSIEIIEVPVSVDWNHWNLVFWWLIEIIKTSKSLSLLIETIEIAVFFFEIIDIPVSVGINKSIFVWWHQAHPARPTDSADLRNGLESQRQHSQVLLLCQHESCCEAI